MIPQDSEAKVGYEVKSRHEIMLLLKDYAPKLCYWYVCTIVAKDAR